MNCLFCCAPHWSLILLPWIFVQLFPGKNTYLLNDHLFTEPAVIFHCIILSLVACIVSLAFWFYVLSPGNFTKYFPPCGQVFTMGTFSWSVIWVGLIWLPLLRLIVLLRSVVVSFCGLIWLVLLSWIWFIRTGFAPLPLVPLVPIADFLYFSTRISSICTASCLISARVVCCPFFFIKPAPFLLWIQQWDKNH
jgi:hypothetical protein